MTPIKATIKDGRLEVDVPADWPDGIDVEIHPVDTEANGGAETMSPAEIAATLAAMDRIEPFEMSDAEEATWESERQARRERDKATFASHADELRKDWE